MGRSFHHPGMVNENVLESDFEPFCDGTTRRRTLLYASINVLNLMRAATGSQCKEIKRGVTWALLGSLKTSRAAAF